MAGPSTLHIRLIAWPRPADSELSFSSTLKLLEMSTMSLIDAICVNEEDVKESSE